MSGGLRIKVGGTYIPVGRGPQGLPGAAVITPVAVTAAPSAYPARISIFWTTDAAWPLGGPGLVITHLDGGKGFQVFHTESGTHFTRTATTGDAWTAWFAPGNIYRIVYTTSWPARPPGATYVNWVGPSSAQASIPSMLDGDTFTSTSG